MTNPDREELLCYADSLNQQANWIEEALAPETPDSQRIGIEDIDIDELRGASDLLRRLASSDGAVNGEPVATKKVYIKPLRTGLGGKPELSELADAIKDRISDLERQLAAETERCACIAQDNRQHSNQIVMRTLEAESAYEEACDDIAAAIRGGAK
jgi:hypothetical protein